MRYPDSIPINIPMFYKFYKKHDISVLECKSYCIGKYVIMKCYAVMKVK